MPTLPTLFISHGGGPCFWMDFPPPFEPAGFARLAAYFGGILDRLPQRPRAILVVTAHWEEQKPHFATAAWPGMLYDYNGFPRHTYELQFPAPGAPELAGRARDLLAAAGIESGENASRGFDHGVFVPMMKITPDADIPVLEMSVCADLDPARHMAIGRALAPLRDEGVLIIGSGLSYHNLRALARPPNGPSEAWDQWLVDAATAGDADSRNAMLQAWRTAPHAREAHPREEHLIPLMVTAGAAGQDAGIAAYRDHLAGKAVCGFEFWR